MARDESSELLHCSLSSNFLNIFSVPLSYRNFSETDAQFPKLNFRYPRVTMVALIAFY